MYFAVQGYFFLFFTDDTKAETGSSNLLVEHGMEQAYQKFFGRKTKESLSSFLTHLPGNHAYFSQFCILKLSSSSFFAYILGLVDVPGNANEGYKILSVVFINNCFRVFTL